MRLPEALLPRNPTWESSHFWGLTKVEILETLESPKSAANKENPTSFWIIERILRMYHRQPNRYTPQFTLGQFAVTL